MFNTVSRLTIMKSVVRIGDPPKVGVLVLTLNNRPHATTSYTKSYKTSFRRPQEKHLPKVAYVCMFFQTELI